MHGIQMMAIGTWELVLVVFVVLVVFGVGKLPKVMGQLGEGVRSFREAAQNRPGNDAQAQANPPPTDKPAA